MYRLWIYKIAIISGLLSICVGASQAAWVSGLSGAPAKGSGTGGDFIAGGPNGTTVGFSNNGVLNPTAPQFSPPVSTGADGVTCFRDATMFNGSANLTCATSAPFNSKLCNVTHGAGCTGSQDAIVMVWGAGTSGASLIAHIVGYTSTSVVTTDATPANVTTVSSQRAWAGYDWQPALNSWFGTHPIVSSVNSYAAPGIATARTQDYDVPPGVYMVGSGLTPQVISHMHIKCRGSVFIYTGTADFLAFGDGSSFVHDDSIEGCTVFVSDQMTGSVMNWNHADKGRARENKIYGYNPSGAGPAIRMYMNGDGNELTTGNDIQGFPIGINCVRCDDSFMMSNDVSQENTATSAPVQCFVAGDPVPTNPGVNSAGVSIEGNKCNCATANTGLCIGFDIGAVTGGVVKANYYEGTTGSSGNVGVRIAYLNQVGHTAGLLVMGNILNGHNEATGAAISAAGSGTSPVALGIVIGGNFINAWTNGIDGSSGVAGNPRSWSVLTNEYQSVTNQVVNLGNSVGTMLYSPNETTASQGYQQVPNLCVGAACTDVTGGGEVSIKNDLSFTGATASVRLGASNFISGSLSGMFLCGNTTSCTIGGTHIKGNVAAGASTELMRFGSGIWSGASATIAFGTNDYISFGGQPANAVIGTEANAQLGWPFAGTASNLQCKWGTAAQAGGVIFVVRDNGVDTALTFTATSGTTGLDTTHTFAVTANDLLDVHVTNNNAANATGNVACSFVVSG